MMKTLDDSALCALIVDDEADARSNLTHILERLGIKVITASDGYQALEKIESSNPAPKVVLLDVSMPGLSGMEVLKKIRKRDSELPVIFITGYANIHQSVMAMRDGAYDYIAKPFDNNEVEKITLRALSEGRLRKHIPEPEPIRSQEYVTLFTSMGPSNNIARVASEVHRVAKSDFSILLFGESGSGKELVATAIHRDSHRNKAPFIAIDCGAIPEPLLESELFGHEKGSFTGADKKKLGKFEEADGGTLFLDEVSNLPFSSQSKLLRAIQSRTLNRVGGSAPIKVDFRIIAATNQNLREMVLSGTFREDLYYRLCDFTINIPPLRERKEDILYLAKQFLDLTIAELGKKTICLSEAAVNSLLSYNWPGNVRELKSVIRRATLLAKGDITEADLGMEKTASQISTSFSKVDILSWKNSSLREIVSQNIIEVEKRVIMGVLQYTGGNKAKAARLLHIDYKTMHTKVKKFGIYV